MVGTIEGDRTSFVPRHDGDNILPADPLFTRLLALAHRPEQKTVIRDVNNSMEKSAAELLNDTLRLRGILRSSLHKQAIEDINHGKEVFISILCPGSYEFTVGVLAILALGAASSAISPAMPVNEATYYVNKAKTSAVLVSDATLKMGEALAEEIRRTSNSNFIAIPISRFSEAPSFNIKDILLSSNLWFDPNSPGIIIFTSGTTGPPKGAVIRRASITEGALSFAQQLGLSSNDTILHIVPVHHATGIWINFFPAIQTGACIEFRSGSFSDSWTWDRIRRGGITVFSGVPTIYMRMMRYWQETISKMPAKEQQQYKYGVNQIRLMICGTSALPQPIDQFWKSLRDGRRIVQRYGSTETGVVFNMPFEKNDDVPDGSVGEVTLGVDVKLSEGDEGEVLMKSFNMSSKYLHDPEATKKAHTADGYYKTGDIARRGGKYYFITGRASVDIIKSGGYKISALDIERELLSLPYTAEAMVVGVPDDEFGQRVAAVITLRNDEMAQKFYHEKGRSAKDININDLRTDARSRLAGYKLPTLLRVLQGEIPKSSTGKVQKKLLGPLYFPPNYKDDPEVQVWSNKKQSKI